ncbi:hypothetical protein ACJMK2_033813 [Sinanodonta woodiana]|uniref:DBB domain-containing protein n=1 Tax=Sinanodonta woodiana TaxID=1069815 RepID=A0ABD3WTB3_SINWO
MSGDFVHSIFCQQDGNEFAHRIKDIFAGRRYNVEFNIHRLESANATNIFNTGLSILLLTPAMCDFIRSGRHQDLNVLFHYPEFSIAIIFCVEMTKADIATLLSSRIMDFDKWTMLEFRTESGLTPVNIDIMGLIEKLENHSLQKFQVWTPDGVKPHQQVILIFTVPVDDDLQVNVIQKWDGLKVMAERLNPMTYIFPIGAVEPGYRHIEVFVNEISYGRAVLHVLHIEPKIEQMAVFLDGVINPIEHLCQCLHIVHATRENLDRKLVDLLSKNTSSVSHITEEFNWESYGDSKSNLELPTLLHFGAKYGLRLFCLELLKLPGGKHALKIKNKFGFLPHQIAQKEGFEHLELILWRNQNVDIYVKLKPPSGIKGHDNIRRSETLPIRGHGTQFLTMSMRETRPTSISAQHPSPLSRSTVDRSRVHSDSENITETTPFSEKHEITPEVPPRLHRKMTKVTSARDEGQQIGTTSRLLIRSLPELGRIMRKERPYDTIDDV